MLEFEIFGWMKVIGELAIRGHRSLIFASFFYPSFSWKSKKQTTVSWSSSEAEYRSLAQATCDAPWFRYLINDFQIPSPALVAIFCYNQSTTNIAANIVFHERTKHIEIDCYIVYDKVQQGVIHLLPIHTKDQLVDFLTTPLAPGPFCDIKSKLGMFDTRALACRGCHRIRELVKVSWLGTYQ